MKILAFDVSTTATGCVIYDQKTETHEPKLFPAKEAKPYDRIRRIAKDVKEWIKDKKFDMVLITKASYSQMSPSILQLEGILLAIAVERDIPFDYYPDSSWYSLIGANGDERPTKKKKSIERYINFHHYEVMETDIKMHGAKLDKINVKIMEMSGMPIPEPMREKWISDDIADAWNAANLFSVRQEREKLKFEKSSTQSEINSLRKENKKLRNSIILSKRDIEIAQAEFKKYEKLYKATGHKGKLNAMNHRSELIEANTLYLKTIKGLIKSNEEKVKVLMHKKNNL